MKLTYFKKDLKKNLNDFKSIKTLYKQIPNILTTSRIVAPIPINILFFSGNIIGALTVSAIAFFTDALDGPLARKFKVSSQFGADLDAVSDKLLIGGIAIPIVVQNPIMILNIILEGLISFTNIKARLEGKRPKSSMIGKVKTWILSLTIIAGYFTSILGLDISLLTSALAITPALIAQSVALTGYIKTNNQVADKQREEIHSSNLNNNIDKSIKAKQKQKEVTNTKVSIENLQKLKQELINSKNEDKDSEIIKKDENKGNAKTKTFPK